MIQSVSSVFERELRKLIAEERARVSEILVDGRSVTTMDDYRGHVSYVRALDTVIDLCDTAQETVNKTL